MATVNRQFFEKSIKGSILNQNILESSLSLDREVEIVEIGARDGLQNENVIFTTAQKVEMITRAIDAGVKRLEVASFVNPKRVPQMADAEALVAALPDLRDVSYIGLILNERGYQRGLATRDSGRRGIDEVGCVTVASDTFASKNQGQTRIESVEVAKKIIARAKSDGFRAQVTLSAAFGCPFEGEIDPDIVVDMAKNLAEAGPCELAIADTIGVAAPGQVFDLFSRLRETLPEMPMRAHFHNTRNTGIANAWAAYQAGVRILDSSVGGIGGCPFAPNATGNIGTEDLLYMLDRSNIETGVSLEKIVSLAACVEEYLGHATPAMVSKAGGFPNS